MGGGGLGSLGCGSLGCVCSGLTLSGKVGRQRHLVVLALQRGCCKHPIHWGALGRRGGICLSLGNLHDSGEGEAWPWSVQI